ncbi:MAG: phBC6A51 family helix-turn-helix protein [Candidatus Magnetobacterium sp. LHC-1]
MKNKKVKEITPDSTNEKNSINPKWIAIIDKLLDFDDRKTIEEKCNSIGICKKTLYNWMKIPEFVQLKNERLQLFMDLDESEVYKSMRTQIKRGNTTAIRTYYELAGKLNQKIGMELTGKDGNPIGMEVKYNFGMPEPPSQNGKAPEDDEEDPETP